jgi:hypothetical protein
MTLTTKCDRKFNKLCVKKILNLSIFNDIEENKILISHCN